ncbi:MAG: hypothetical protein HC821_01375 [Lewinella sp.]|nr:hypothetical protein [Lewinella sp.]
MFNHKTEGEENSMVNVELTQGIYVLRLTNETESKVFQFSRQ